MTLDLRRLRYFVAVAEELHFGRAATRLHVAQPSLSQQVRTLEQELGVELLHRDHRTVALTQAGDALLREGRRTLAQAERAVDAARTAARGPAGALSVGFMGSAGRRLLPLVVRDFHSRHPDVAIDVREVALADTHRVVRAGVVDVAFVRPFEDDPEVAVHPLPGDALLVALPSEHPLAGAAALPLAALAGEPFVRPDAAAGLGPWLAFLGIVCDRHGFAPRFAAAEASSLQAMVGLVAAGAGVCIVSATTHTLPREGVVAVPIEDEEMPLALAWRAHDRSPSVARFVTLTHEHVAAGRPLAATGP